MKFTEEQYQEIIEAWEGECSYPNAMKAVIEKINGYASLLPDFNTTNKAIVIANPLTREWAHEQFVEKEKKYYWTGSKENNDGFVKRLYKYGDGMIVDHSIRKEYTDKAEDEQLTESEIREWGYNPEMFDKEEVE